MSSRGRAGPGSARGRPPLRRLVAELSAAAAAEIGLRTAARVVVEARFRDVPLALARSLVGAAAAAMQAAVGADHAPHLRFDGGWTASAGSRVRLLCARFVLPEAAFGALQVGLAAGLLEVETPAGRFVGPVHAQGAMGGWRP